jgi:hypothetical protein
MAFTSGEASGYQDLLVKLVNFATSNGWVVLSTQTASRVFLKGTGLAGLDEIYVGINTYETNAPVGQNWEMAGFIAKKSNDNFTQPGRSNTYCAVTSAFWTGTIPYWISANPRRIILAAKISSGYYSFVHLGFLNPPATPAQYPYPLFIGGSNTEYNQNYSNTKRNSFWKGDSYSGDRVFSPGLVYMPEGAVWGCLNHSYIFVDFSSPALLVYSIYQGLSGAVSTGIDGSYLLEPIWIKDRHRNALLGEIDGLFRVTGYGENTAENIITVDGVNYIVFPNVYRTDYANLCALRMN